MKKKLLITAKAVERQQEYICSNIKPYKFINSPVFSIFLVKVVKEGGTLEIYGETVPSPRAPLLLKEVSEPGKKFCPKCTLGLDIKHTDVLILSQYLRSDGCILPRRITGLCNTQQKNIGTMIKMAQKAGTHINIVCVVE